MERVSRKRSSARRLKTERVGEKKKKKWKDIVQQAKAHSGV
jgi:hypothetical protein